MPRFEAWLTPATYVDPGLSFHICKPGVINKSYLIGKL